MNAIARTIVLVGVIAIVFVVEMYVAQDAEAVFGTRRRTAMMTAAVVHSSDEQKADSSQQAAAGTTQAATTTTTQPAATPSAGTLPIGTIVPALPANCPETTEKGVAYYKCDGNYYRAAFQGSTLVYVTAQP